MFGDGATEIAPASEGFFRRRLVRPLKALLLQGITPRKVTATLATGTVCSLFPFLGLTSALNLVVGLGLRMNQPILQTLNQLLGPLQLLLIVAYVRLGEFIWRADAMPVSVGAIARSFRDDGIAEFLRQFGWAGVHAFSAWLLTAPLLFALVYYPLQPVVSRLGRRAMRSESPKAGGTP